MQLFRHIAADLDPDNAGEFAGGKLGADHADDATRSEVQLCFAQRQTIPRIVLGAAGDAKAVRIPANAAREQQVQMLATYCFIEAQAPEEIVMRRLQEREGDSREVSDARLENLDMLNRSYEVPLELQSNNLVTVTTNRAPEETIAETLKSLVLAVHYSSKRENSSLLSLSQAR